VNDAKAAILQKRVAWTSKLSIYQPFFYSGKQALKNLTPEQLASARLDPDVATFTTSLSADWENIFTTQVTKLISVNLYTRWLYDKYDNSVKPVVDPAGDISNADAVRGAVRKAGQFKETLSIGVTYRFL
jgi:hypothetical protein